MPQLKTKTGRLTRYALACGYIERTEYRVDTNDFAVVTLCMSGSTILVKTYTRSDSHRSEFTTQRMKIARTVYARECRRLKDSGCTATREQVIYSKGNN